MAPPLTPRWSYNALRLPNHLDTGIRVLHDSLDGTTHISYGSLTEVIRLSNPSREDFEYALQRLVFRSLLAQARMAVDRVLREFYSAVTYTALMRFENE